MSGGHRAGAAPNLFFRIAKDLTMFEPRNPAVTQRPVARRPRRAAAALAAAALLGASAHADTLSEIYQLARANDPIFGAAQATAAAGREKEAQGRAGILPTVTATATYPRDVEHSSAVASGRRV